MTIKTMLEELGMDDEGNDDPVPLSSVNTGILTEIIHTGYDGACL